MAEGSEKQIILDALGRENIPADEAAAEKLAEFARLLTEKNKVMNLTAITEFGEIVTKHFADSLILERFVKISDCREVLDVGSGAGIPGIPLAVLFPAVSFTLIDAVGKKVSFHKEVKEALNLDNLESVHARTEDAAHLTEMRERFDLVTARAVANLSTLSEYCLPFVKPGGLFAAYKSDSCDEEIRAAENALKILKGKIKAVHRYEIDGMGRTMILIEKTDRTPKKYPRRAGTPSKNPL